MSQGTKLQWGRILVTAFVMELVLFAVLVPVLLIFETPVALAIIPIGVALLSFVITRWFGRRLRSHFVLHGVLIGVVATLIYLGLVIAQGALPAAIEMYGPPLFVLGNGLRIVGAALGAASAEKRRTLA